MSKEIKII